MQSIRLAICALFLILRTNFLLYGMSGDRIDLGIPGAQYTHELPPITAEDQRAFDAVTAQALQEFAERWQKKQEIQKEIEQSLEHSVKRENKEDTNEPLQPIEAASSSSSSNSCMQPTEGTDRESCYK